jgi:hypothetical protein
MLASIQTRGHRPYTKSDVVFAKVAPKCRQAEWLQALIKGMFSAHTDIALGA